VVQGQAQIAQEWRARLLSSEGRQACSGGVNAGLRPANAAAGIEISIKFMGIFPNFTHLVTR